MDAHSAVNQRFWDEIAPLHAASDYYDVDRFLAGATSLGDVEIAEVGEVVTALIDAGISIEFLHEFPSDVPSADGPAATALPGLFSVRGKVWPQ